MVASIVRGAAERLGLVGPREQSPGALEREAPRVKKPPAPMKKRNAPRLAKLHDEAFGEQADLCRRRPCLVRGCRGRTVPHHVRPRGMGGVHGKDRDTVPLCWVHHDQAHTSHEQLGLTLEELQAEAEKLAAELAARPAHDCEDFARLIERAPGLVSFYRCERCGYVLPDEQEGGDA